MGRPKPEELRPRKQDLNKTVGHGAQPADKKALGHLARGQGTTTKQDAKDAKEER